MLRAEQGLQPCVERLRLPQLHIGRVLADEGMEIFQAGGLLGLREGGDCNEDDQDRQHGPAVALHSHLPERSQW